MKKFQFNGRVVLFFLLALLFSEDPLAVQANLGKNKTLKGSLENETRVDGFRSAQFGMNEKNVYKAIY